MRKTTAKLLDPDFVFIGCEFLNSYSQFVEEA